MSSSHHPTPADCIAGIFVGGRSQRMLGTPKGLLLPPGARQNLVERLASAAERVGVPRIVLVGANAAYRQMPYATIPDSPEGQGPMAGLRALVEYARTEGYRFVLAVACDMPFVSEKLLARLIGATASAAAVVPRREHWEPLCARYEATTVLPVLRQLMEAGNHRMMSLLDALGPRCRELPVAASDACELEDWDAPGDLPDGVTLGGVPVVPSSK